MQPGGEKDVDQNNSTSDMTFSRIDDDSGGIFEESKRLDDSEASFVNENQRMTTKEKVAKLKADLKKRKALLRGELIISDEAKEKENLNDVSISIDTSK